jgi:transcription antitermination factor NusG
MNSVLGLSRWGRQLAKKLSKPNQKFKPIQETNRWNIVSGDLVRVINGPQTGQQGNILQVLRAKNRVIVEGVNMVRYFYLPICVFTRIDIF